MRFKVSVKTKLVCSLRFYSQHRDILVLDDKRYPLQRVFLSALDVGAKFRVLGYACSQFNALVAESSRMGSSARSTQLEYCAPQGLQRSGASL